MNKSCTSCIKGADEFLKCPYCKGYSVKNGKSRSGKQRFHCKECMRYFLEYYTRQSYLPKTNWKIVGLLKEGLGISSLSRNLKIGKAEQTQQIKKINTQLDRLEERFIMEEIDKEMFVKYKQKFTT